MTPGQFLKLAMAMPEAEQSRLGADVHIKVAGKTFTTSADGPRKAAALLLTRDQQQILCEAEPDIFKPVPSTWGSKGWTHLYVADADQRTVESALWMAWRNRAPKTLQKKYPGSTI